MIYSKNSGYRLPQNDSSNIALFGKISLFQRVNPGNQVTGIFRIYLFVQRAKQKKKDQISSRNSPLVRYHAMTTSSINRTKGGE